MGHIYTSADQLIGGTPLLELSRLEREEGLEARILAKLECFNPAGSVKDRVARAMVDDAERRGLLRPGSVIIEPNRPGRRGRCQGIPGDHRHAGDHEPGAAAADARLRRGAGAD